ncbi:MAG: hypothetical protein L6Q83_01205 [Gammaproteobacteria bacterium]|nr:hypothetical protein [Gammaproteobacteria bacterium]
MSQLKVMAIVLLIAGALALAYGSFSYTKETTKARLGSLELSVRDRETVNIPVWAGVAALAAGGGLLLLGTRKGQGSS